MVNYLREWNDRIILVRPTKWNAAEEVAPWDCLDFTDAIKEREEEVLPILIWLLNLRPIIQSSLLENPSHYRSKHFCRTHKDNPRMDVPLFGCCVVATEALLFLTQHYLLTMGAEHTNQYGSREITVEPWKVKDFDGIYHHYIMLTKGAGLQQYPNGNPFPFEAGITQHEIDATATQFRFPNDWEIPYGDGKKTALMGWKQSPSKRTLDLIENCLTKSVRYKSFDGSYANPNLPGTLDAFFTDAE